MFGRVRIGCSCGLDFLAVSDVAVPFIACSVDMTLPCLNCGCGHGLSVLTAA